MPRKPKQPCAYPGCPNLSDGRYCEQHRKLVEKNYEQYSRNPAVHKKYGRAWKRIRDSYVKMHPFCERCFEQGILVPVDEVHHKIPISQGGTHDRSNLMSLCKSCHNKIHHEIGDRYSCVRHPVGAVKISEALGPGKRHPLTRTQTAVQTGY